MSIKRGDTDNRKVDFSDASGLEFIDEIGGGPGVRLRNWQQLLDGETAP